MQLQEDAGFGDSLKTKKAVFKSEFSQNKRRIITDSEYKELINMLTGGAPKV